MKVTKDATRPAGDDQHCFYCNQPVGGHHLPTCELIHKKAVVRMTVEYTIEVPACWTRSDINHHRNESSWCATNALAELEDLSDCLCGVLHFEAISTDDNNIYLREL